MNLVGTLAKVAMGVMLTRGVGKMLGGGRGGGGGLGGLLGGLLGGSSGAGASGGGASGGLGDMLGKAMSGAGGSGSGGGGLGDLLSGLGGNTQASSPSASSTAPSNQQSRGDIGELLNEAFGGSASRAPTQEQNSQAEILLRAMINSAKADGEIDRSEQQKIVEHLGDVTQEEVAFVQHEMAQPLDVSSFIRSVPRGMEQQVYLMSLLGIDLDSQAEARYLDQLAKGMGISHELSNQIHEKVGVPALYA